MRKILGSQLDLRRRERVVGSNGHLDLTAAAGIHRPRKLRLGDELSAFTLVRVPPFQKLAQLK